MKIKISAIIIFTCVFNVIIGDSANSTAYMKILMQRKVNMLTQLLPHYDKKYECLVCKKSFESKKVRSRFIKVTKSDSDFCPYYSSDEADPILYYVKVCPDCGFSFSDDFTPYFPPGSMETIIEKVCSQWVPHDYGGSRNINDAIKTYKLASYCGTLKEEKHITLSGIYMRLAWLYRKLEDEDQEQRFMKLALYQYKESFMKDDFRGTQMTGLRLQYLIGELSLRTGDIDQAVQFFSKVIEQQRNTTELKTVEMAKERWYEIREMRKKENEEDPTTS